MKFVKVTETQWLQHRGTDVCKEARCAVKMQLFVHLPQVDCDATFITLSIGVAVVECVPFLSGS